jgi:competence ComEA-like helix-hairpin-helix protein
MDNNFFYFSRAERIGIIVLIVICIGLFVVPVFLPDRSQQGTTDFTALEEQIASWESASGIPENEENTSNAATMASPAAFNANTATEAQLQAVGLSSGSIRSWRSYMRKGGKFNKWQDVEKFRALSSAEKEKIRPYVRFENAATPGEENPTVPLAITTDFDPNQVDKETLIRMGLSAKVASNWTRFLASGGRFRQAEDIQKIYGLEEADFQRLLPFARVPDTSSDETEPGPFADASAFPESYDNSARNVIVDINTATVEEWQALRGIGPAFSRRIVNFRDKLGGFVSVQQVSETYGLPDSVFQKIQLQLRPSAIQRKLPVNTATLEELAAHPYLRFSDARMLINYREEHGRYTGPGDLDKLYGLEEATKQKILPYLAY